MVRAPPFVWALVPGSRFPVFQYCRSDVRTLTSHRSATFLDRQKKLWKPSAQAFGKPFEGRIRGLRRPHCGHQRTLRPTGSKFWDIFKLLGIDDVLSGHLRAEPFRELLNPDLRLSKLPLRAGESRPGWVMPPCAPAPRPAHTFPTPLSPFWARPTLQSYIGC